MKNKFLFKKAHEDSRTIFENDNGNNENIYLPFAINSSDEAEDGSESIKTDHEIVILFHLYISLSFVNLGRNTCKKFVTVSILVAKYNSASGQTSILSRCVYRTLLNK